MKQGISNDSTVPGQDETDIGITQQSLIGAHNTVSILRAKSWGRGRGVARLFLRGKRMKSADGDEATRERTRLRVECFAFLVPTEFNQGWFRSLDLNDRGD